MVARSHDAGLILRIEKEQIAKSAIFPGKLEAQEYQILGPVEETPPGRAEMIFESAQSFGRDSECRRSFPRKQGTGTAFGRRRKKFRLRQNAEQQQYKQRRGGGKDRAYHGAFFGASHTHKFSPMRHCTPQNISRY